MSAMKPKTYTELLEIVKQFETNDPALERKQLALLRARTERLRETLDPILGSSRWDEPIEVHNVRAALSALEEAFTPPGEAKPEPYSSKSRTL